MDDLHFPNGIAVSPDNSTAGDRRLHGGPDGLRHLRHRADVGHPGGKADPLHLTFQTVRAGTYLPGTGCPDGLHYDVKGNLWIAAAAARRHPAGRSARHHRRLCADPERRSGDDQLRLRRPRQPRHHLRWRANSGTFWRFKAPYPGPDRPRRRAPRGAAVAVVRRPLASRRPTGGGCRLRGMPRSIEWSATSAAGAPLSA